MQEFILPALARSIAPGSAASILADLPAVADDGKCVLRLVGEIDLAATDALTSTAPLCLHDIAVDTLIIDLADVTFLDAAGMGGLVRVRAAAQRRGKTVDLARVPQHIDRLLRIGGLDVSFGSTRASLAAVPRSGADGRFSAEGV